jgi:hypothetical protein
LCKNATKFSPTKPEKLIEENFKKSVDKNARTTIFALLFRITVCENENASIAQP